MVTCLDVAEKVVTLPPTATWLKDPGDGLTYAQKDTQYETFYS
jgi:hypothetical protein